MKRILKPTKEVWSNVSFHVREATRQRVSPARKAAEKQSIDFNAMVDAAVNEVFDEILRPSGKTSAFNNGTTTVSHGDEG
jgi:hypothetical protein